MEYWHKDEKIAFTTLNDNGEFFAKLGDITVMERTYVTGPPFRHTASFITLSDARTYLLAKFPQAEERFS